MKKVICFSPHPDDEVLGCGGSLLKAKKKGYEIAMVYMTNGEYGSPDYDCEELSKIRKEETKKVCDHLGISEQNTHYLNLGDNNIQSSNLDAMKKIMEIVRLFKPDIAYIPHIKELSYDHQQTNILVLRALGMAGSRNFIKYGNCAWWTGTVLAYEVWTAIESEQYGEDISEFIDEKITLLSYYDSQKKSAGNVSDFVGEKAKHINGYRAAMTVGEFRETFEVVRVDSIL